MWDTHTRTHTRTRTRTHTHTHTHTHTRARTMSPARGAFLVFEGLDRCGKSTQAKLLVEHLTSKGRNVRRLCFPERSTPTGQKIDAYLQNKAEIQDEDLHKMFSDNRREFKEDIESFVRDGGVIVTDRYAYSGVAYSIAKGLDKEWCKKADSGLPEPDVVYFLDIKPKDAAMRGEYGGERYERVDFQEKVSSGFDWLREPWWRIISAQQTQEALHTEIAAHADRLIAEMREDAPVKRLWV
eukprot:TRINITY_DN1522_c1_g1_i1.p1 TRINITY_DN1522_c1_g1~~TRINITY_DN1522_c1_g1_i1.p1  ORF type:complete len:240 (-),score=40.96 TRINITY_DN1522_c1_g1_i1:800-1519(-)